MEEKYYDYINVLAFQCLYQYENKKSINVDKLAELELLILWETLLLLIRKKN